MGEVRRARDLKLHRDVAIKFLRPDLAGQPEARRRFAGEARNAARLTHPNVVLVLDTGEYQGRPYLVMECLAGHTLHDELQRGPLSEERARVVVRDVLAGLAAAHDLGIIHRDVSPSNILLTDDGRAKLADFGIAKTAEGIDHTLVGQVLGTPAYLSPERLRGEPATPASDVYALGVTFYEAITGERPFKGDTPVAVAQSVLATTPPPLAQVRPDIDRDLTDTVDTAMSADPELRPSAAALLATAEGTEEPPTALLTTVSLASEPAMATVAAEAFTDMPPTIAERDKRERRVVLVTIATIAVIGVLLLGLANARGGDEPVNATVPTTVTTAPPTTVSRAVVGVSANNQVVTRENRNDGGGAKRKGKGGKR